MREDVTACGILAAVSQQDLDFVLSAYARFNAGEHVPASWFWHEDGEYETSSADPDSAVHSGLEAIRRQFERWLETYPDLQVEPLEARAQGDKVFVWTRFVGRGASSGVPIDMNLAQVYEMRDGRALRCVEYMDRDEGLAAAGLHA